MPFKKDIFHISKTDYSLKATATEPMVKSIGNLMDRTVTSDRSSKPHFKQLGLMDKSFWGSAKSRKRTGPEKEALLKKLDRAGSRKEKGLKHFSAMVKQQLEQRRDTTFPQIAEDLMEGSKIKQSNLRRRVYDCLNILVALGAVQRLRNKGIRWRGLPTQRPTLDESMKKEVVSISRRIEGKRQHLLALRRERKAVSDLIAYNKWNVGSTEGRLQIPFMLVTSPLPFRLETATNDAGDMATITSRSPLKMINHQKVLFEAGFGSF